MKPVFFFAARELHAVLLNRVLLAFSGLALFAGVVPLLVDMAGNPAATAAYILLQASLYIIPLLAILISTGSAQNEAEEQTLLMSQPVHRSARVAGKFVALWFAVLAAALLLVIPAAIAGAEPLSLLSLWAYASGTGAIFTALGLAIGFTVSDRVKAHMAALVIWMFFIVGGDLIALGFAQTGLMQDSPSLWLVILMVNPLDALRISGLLSLERIPFDISVAPPIGQWWLSHLGLWFTVLVVVWSSLALGWSVFRLERQDL